MTRSSVRQMDDKLDDEQLLDALGAQWKDHERSVRESTVPLDEQTSPVEPAWEWDRLWAHALARGMPPADIELQAQRRSTSQSQQHSVSACCTASFRLSPTVGQPSQRPLRSGT